MFEKAVWLKMNFRPNPSPKTVSSPFRLKIDEIPSYEHILLAFSLKKIPHDYEWM